MPNPQRPWILSSLVLAALLSAGATAAAQAEDWSRFRGPERHGHRAGRRLSDRVRTRPQPQVALRRPARQVVAGAELATHLPDRLRRGRALHPVLRSRHGTAAVGAQGIAGAARSRARPERAGGSDARHRRRERLRLLPRLRRRLLRRGRRGPLEEADGPVRQPDGRGGVADHRRLVARPRARPVRRVRDRRAVAGDGRGAVAGGAAGDSTPGRRRPFTRRRDSRRRSSRPAAACSAATRSRAAPGCGPTRAWRRPWSPARSSPATPWWASATATTRRRRSPKR